MSQRIAFFDFDGTITTKDTLLEFAKFNKGPAYFYLGFLLTSPWMVAYKLKVISNQRAKERFLRFFFRGSPLSEFGHSCDAFAAKALPALLRRKALAEIHQLKEKGFRVVIVSASPENWIRPWTESMGVDLLATRLIIKEDKITGRIQDRNCHGEEKVRRIKEAFALPEYDEIYAYGDTGGDRPMLALAGNSFYKPFR